MKPFPISHSGSCRIALVLAVAALLQPAGPAWGESPVELQPHRALYSAKLHKADQASGISEVGGTMGISMEKTCDGWILAQQLAVDISLTNGGSARQEVRFAGWESVDGLSYRFATRQLLGANEVAIKGSARLSAAGGSGTATFEAPARKTTDLPEGTVFPITHTRLIISAARERKTLDTRVVFEGGGAPVPQRVTAFIGPRRSPDAGAVERFGPLVEQPAWPVRMAVFELASQAAEPSYEIGALQLANGVVRELVLDLGGFTLKLNLQSIEPIPEPKC